MTIDALTGWLAFLALIVNAVGLYGAWASTKKPSLVFYAASNGVLAVGAVVALLR